MPSAFATVLEARCPWIGRFEDGIFSCRAKLVKPDAAIYAVAEAKVNLDPANTLLLDDSPHNVHAARARGWRTEIINHPHNDQSVRNALITHRVLRPLACMQSASSIGAVQPAFSGLRRCRNPTSTKSIFKRANINRGILFARGDRAGQGGSRLRNRRGGRYA